MLRCRVLALSLDLGELLRGRVGFEHIRLDGLDLELVRDADDRLNWDLGGPDGEPGHAEVEDEGLTVVFDVRRLEVEDSNVRYRDLADGDTWEFLDLDLAYDGSDRSFTADARMRLADVFASELDLEAAGRLGIGVSEDAVPIEDTRLKASTHLDLGTAKAPELELEAVVSGDVLNGALYGTDVRARMAGLDYAGTLDIVGMYDDFRLTGKGDLHGADVGAACRGMGLPVPEFAAGEEPSALGAGVDFTVDENGITVDAFNARLAGVELDGHLRLNDYAAPDIALRAQSEFIDFNTFLPAPDGEEARDFFDANTEGGGLIVRIDLSEEDVAALRNLDLHLVLAADGFRMGEVEGRNLDLDIQGERGRIHARRVAADFARGGFTADLTADMGEQALGLNCTMVVNGLRAGVAPGGGERFSPVFRPTATLHIGPGDLSASLSAPAFNPRDLLWTLGLPLPEGVVDRYLTKASGSIGIRGGGTRLDVTPLDVTLDDMRITGTGGLNLAHSPRFEFDLAVDRLHPRRYHAQARGSLTEALDAPLAPALEWLRGMDVHGRVRVKTFGWGDTELRGVDLEARAENDALELRRLRADALGGTLDLTGRVALPHDDDVAVSAQLALDGVSLPSAGAVLGLAAPPQGDLTGTVRVSGKAETGLELLRGATGSAALRLPGLVVRPEEGVGVATRGLRLDVDYQGGEASSGGTLLRTVVRARGDTLDADAFAAEDWRCTAPLVLALGRDLALRRLAAKDLRASGTTAWDGRESVRLDVAADARLDTATGALGATVRRLGGLGGNVSGALTVDDVRKPATASGTARFDALDAARVLAIAGERPWGRRTPDVLGAFGGRLDWAWKDGGLALSDVRLTQDKAELTGTLELTGDGSVTFDCKGHGWDLDRYIGGGDEDEDLDAPNRPSALDAPVPVEALRTLHLDGRLDLADVRILGGWFDVLFVEASAKGGALGVDAFRGKAYGGDVNGGLRAVAGGRGLRSELDLDVENIDLGGLLADVAGHPYCTGTAGFSSRIRAGGTTWGGMLGSMSGDASLTVHDGRISGGGDTDAPTAPKGPTMAEKKWAARGDAASRPSPAPPGRKDGAQKAQGTAFDVISASFTVERGVARTTDFTLDGAVADATGQGSIDFAHRTVDLSFEAKAAGVASVPITIKGPFSDVQSNVQGLKALQQSLFRVLSLPLRPFQFLGEKIFGK